MFDKNNSQEINEEINWKQAIKKGVNILVKNQIASVELYDAIMDITKKMGAYYVLEKGICLSHAPIGAYNTKPGVSLVLLKKNIVFNKQVNKQARIIITISAVDSYSHMKYIKEFGTIFTNTKLKENLLKSKSLDQFLKIYHKKGGG